MSAAGPTSASQSLRELFSKLDTEFPRESTAGNRPNQVKLDHVLDLLSGILVSPSEENQEQKQGKIETALRQINDGQGMYATFTSLQKEAVKNILQYAKGDVDEDEATQLLEQYSEGMQGGKRKSRNIKRKTTRRRKHKKTMKKRKTRSRR